jgi:hypothetical protein
MSKTITLTISDEQAASLLSQLTAQNPTPVPQPAPTPVPTPVPVPQPVPTPVPTPGGYKRTWSLNIAIPEFGQPPNKILTDEVQPGDLVTVAFNAPASCDWYFQVEARESPNFMEVSVSNLPGVYPGYVSNLGMSSITYLTTGNTFFRTNIPSGTSYLNIRWPQGHGSCNVVIVAVRV